MSPISTFLLNTLTLKEGAFFFLHMPTIVQVQEFSKSIEPDSNESMTVLLHNAEHYKTEFDFEV